MRYAPTANIALDKRKAKIKDGVKCYPLKIRVTFARDSRFYQLDKDYNLTDDEFAVWETSRKGEIIAARRMAINQLAKANKILDEIRDYFTFDEFKRIYYSKTKSSKDVYSIYEEYINTLKQNAQFSTAGLYTTSLISLKQYKKNLHFREITPEFLEKYAKTFDDGIIPSAYVRNLRTIYNYAISKKVIDKGSYPFGKHGYKIPNTPRRNIFLANEAAKLLYQYYELHKEDKINSKILALDIFLFSYNCNGMNFSDIVKLKFKDIDIDFENERYILYARGKTINRTNNPKTVPIYLNEIVEDIIKKYTYSYSKKDDYIFPVLIENMTNEAISIKIGDTRSRFDKRLKDIASELSINKFSFNYARHTYITDKKKKGHSYETINDSIGNKSIEMTRGYVDQSQLHIYKEISQENLKKFVGENSENLES
ncbi:phage integrase SAM-like domain-containing protein [Dysgonomonas sp. 520]|uniref:tyrosine-type recombinase/integrase n=1 Tax=Dysgonomonas sp. 520 TaxID=2302931 RepID=UPI0013D8C608|nr:phage integrase SAM-like domain-containing protein [Dysgonomonas sp. 520]NDW08462.1 hypothetical protein [Dysgonomonas sp. 520]